MKLLKLDDGTICVQIPEDGSRLTIQAPGFVYDEACYVSLNYGNCINLELSGATAGTNVQLDGNEICIRMEKLLWYARFPEHGYRKPDPGPDIRLTFRIRLQDGELLFITETPEGLDMETLQLSFPRRFLSWDTRTACELAGAFHSSGELFRFPASEAGFLRCDGVLPVAGLFRQSGGIGIYAQNSFDHSLEISVNQPNPQGWCGFAHEFLPGKSEYARSVCAHFFPEGRNYADLAKWYRAKVKAEHRFLSLREKAEQCPEVEKLAGAVIWKHNVYSTPQLPPGVKRDWSLYVRSREAAEAEGRLGNWTAREVFQTAHDNGFDRVCIFNTGWNRYGFDSGYPTRFPVNPERGSMADFTRAAEEGRALSPDYIYSVHDNYRDVYANSPEFRIPELMTDIDGVPVRGGIWRGGRCYLMCGKCALEYARRDLPKIAEMAGRGAIYLDVQGCVPLRPCYHPEHAGSRRDDAQWRLEIFREAKRRFGAVATEGSPHDFAVRDIDLGAYCVIKAGGGRWNCRPIPFFQLVYHDSVLQFTGEGVSGVWGGEFQNYVALYGMLPHRFDRDSLRISREMRSTFFAEMLTHQFCGDQLVRTEFSDGVAVAANFGNTEEEGIPPHSFQIERE